MVDLFKKQVKYKDKEGAEKTATNFYLRCGDMLVPIEIKYFPGENNVDRAYGGRKTVLLC
ncbi:MAG: hypothetical protein IK147_02850 [Clostridia bacterium]|nr:hypothetical protein [Clostridia bacterium]